MLMGGTFLLKTESYLLTFSRDLSQPGYYKLADGCPALVPPEQLPPELDPLALRLSGALALVMALALMAGGVAGGAAQRQPPAWLLASPGAVAAEQLQQICRYSRIPAAGVPGWQGSRH